MSADVTPEAEALARVLWHDAGPPHRLTIAQRAIDAGYVHRDELVAAGWTPPPLPPEGITPRSIISSQITGERPYDRAAAVIEKLREHGYSITYDPPPDPAEALVVAAYAWSDRFGDGWREVDPEDNPCAGLAAAVRAHREVHDG